MLPFTDILCPKISLCSQDMCSLLFRKDLRCRLKAVHQLQGNVTSNTKRFVIGVLRLVIIKITVGGGCHDHIMTHLCCLDAALHAAPRRHRSVGSQLAFKDLIPADDTTAPVIKEFLHAGSDVALQVVFSSMSVVIGQSQLFDTCLAMGALFPACFG